ncbi:MAG: ComEA family DNA-binding protein, partial [Thermodesulfobacteriota bacterium]
SGKININTASVEQLTNVAGIGPAIAQRIVDYREKNGGFGTVEEIVNVRGIGDKTFEKIKTYITVDR